MAIKKSLKSLKEGHQENLPVHPSDAAAQIPDKLEDKRSKAAADASSDLPTHSSDASVQIPDEKSKLQSADKSIKPELNGQAIADASGKHGNAEAAQIPDSNPALKSDQSVVAEEKEEEEKDEKKEKEADEADEKELKEHLAALVRGEVLPDEFKEKAQTLFATGLKASVDRRVQIAKEKLAEESKKEIESKVTEISEALVDKVDGYLDYVVEEWMKENEVAIEAGLKTEIVENFINGLKGLFEANYIDLPSEKLDLVATQSKKIEELEASLNEEINRGVELKKQLATIEKDSIVAKLCEDLTDLDAAKFKKLCEKTSFEDSESFSQKLKVIKESYFPKSSKTEEKSASLNEVIDGGLKTEEPKASGTSDPLVKATADKLTRLLKN